MKEITVKILTKGYKEGSCVLDKRYFEKGDWVYNETGAYQVEEDPNLFYDGYHTGFEYIFNKNVEGLTLTKQYERNIDL